MLLQVGRDGGTHVTVVDSEKTEFMVLYVDEVSDMVILHGVVSFAFD